MIATLWHLAVLAFAILVALNVAVIGLPGVEGWSVEISLWLGLAGAR